MRKTVPNGRAKMSELRVLIRSLDKALSTLLDVGDVPMAAPQPQGRPRRKSGPSEASLRPRKSTCQVCGESFKNKHARLVHAGIKHKEG